MGLRPKENNMVTALTGTVVALSLLFLQPILLVSATDYASFFTPEQRFVSEAWRQVDNAFIDRTFDKQDWFQL